MGPEEGEGGRAEGGGMGYGRRGSWGCECRRKGEGWGLELSGRRWWGFVGWRGEGGRAWERRERW